jgi:predicted nucleic acid-binding protein
MTVLVDANIVLDVLLDRAPFAQPAATLWAKIEAGEVRGALTSTTVTTIFYIVKNSSRHSQPSMNERRRA